jgi:arginyl-tRNA synthetase
MRLLGESVLARHLEACERPARIPENGYHGEYIRELAEQVAAAVPGLADLPRDEAVSIATERASRILLGEIEADLRVFGVAFDSWVSERSLYESGEVESALRTLRSGGYLYEDGKAVGFRASDFGDEKDRILIRSNGEPTYFTSDIAYHADKIRRGFDRLINIWGADHGGYIPRVKAAIHALGHDPEILQVILLQMVKVLRGGAPVPMSKRTGEFVELREVVNEVGGTRPGSSSSLAGPRRSSTSTSRWRSVKRWTTRSSTSSMPMPARVAWHARRPRPACRGPTAMQTSRVSRCPRSWRS